MFSIIIANWNGDKLIDKCLKSLQNQSFKNFKVYIVENGSTDNSIPLIESFKDNIEIELIKLPKNEGFAMPNNLGIDAAMQDNNSHILTLNNDIELPPDSLKNLYTYITNNAKVDIFQMLMINYFDRDVIDALGITFDKHYYASQLGYKDSLKNLSTYTINIFGACAGAAAYSKTALKAIRNSSGDYFDSNFFAYYEDVDLALRLHSKGFKANIVKDSIAFHMHSATGIKDSPFKEFYITRNLLFYTYKNLPKNVFSIKQFRYYAGFIVRLIRLISKGKNDIALALIKGWHEFYRQRKLLVIDKGADIINE